MYADSIIFDLDGTLWDSVDGILYTWNKVIDRYGVREHITREEQESVMGMQMDDLARKLFPKESPERQMEIMDACAEEENEYLAVYGGTLYPKLRETLERLKIGHRLFIVSNSQRGYIEAFLTAHDLWDLFEGRLCFGDTGRSKGDNIAQVVREYRLKAPVYVGDTQRDKDSAQAAGVPFVFAAYGFGNVDSADAEIRCFEDLIEIFD
ncbi:MAG: HAD family hydrolase [Oscillospiraceae bacterium]|nr:HAD family hydrolase [Oscillospiraceae bacterium]